MFLCRYDSNASESESEAEDGDSEDEGKKKKKVEKKPKKVVKEKKERKPRKEVCNKSQTSEIRLRFHDLQTDQGKSNSAEMLPMIFHASLFKLIGLMGLYSDVIKQEVLTRMTVCRINLY